LLPHVMRANIAALRERAPESPALFRYNEIAVMLTGDVASTPEEGADWVEGLCAELGIPGLESMGISENHFDDLITKAAEASSMKGNPIELPPEELRNILTAAL